MKHTHRIPSLALALLSAWALATPTVALAESVCNLPDPPPSCTPPSDGPVDALPIGSFDEASRWPGGVKVRGWSFDPDDPGSTVTVQIYKGTTRVMSFLANAYRPDVGNVYPSAGNYHGFDNIVNPGYGSYSLCAKAPNLAGDGYSATLACKTVNVTPDPFGALDVVERRPGGVRMAGWVIDPDTSNPGSAAILANGTEVAVLGANVSRPDVGNAFPGYGNLHGYDGIIPLAGGSYTLCPQAVKADNSMSKEITCYLVTIDNDPHGSLDYLQYDGSTVILDGFAVDLDVSDSINVDVYQDGAYVKTQLSDVTLWDFGTHNPGYGDKHGYHTTFPASTVKGTHQVCVTGVNVGPGVSRSLGCKTYTVQGPPSAPSNVTFYSISDVSAGVQWKDNANDETGFRIERQQANGDWVYVRDYGMVGTGGGFVDSGLIANTSYCYRVLAYNSYGSSPWAQGCFTTLKSPIAMPTDLAITQAGQSWLTMAWTDNAPDEDGYSVEVMKASNGATTWGWVPGTLTTGPTGVTVDGLSPGTNYCVRVFGKKAGSADAITTQACASTLAATSISSFTASPGTVQLCGPQKISLAFSVGNSRRVVIKRNGTAIYNQSSLTPNWQGSYVDPTATDRTTSYTLEAYDLSGALATTSSLTVYEAYSYQPVSTVYLSNISYYTAQVGYYDLYGNLLEDLGSVAPGSYIAITPPNCQAKRIRAMVGNTAVWEDIVLGRSDFPALNSQF